MKYTLAILMLFPTLAYAGNCSEYRRQANTHTGLEETYIRQGNYFASMYRRTNDLVWSRAVDRSQQLAEQERTLKAEADREFIQCMTRELR
jgi:hypothetical protein